MSTKYNFDKIIDRHGTGALAVDVLNERYGRPDLTPMWVADMNFETPEFITDTLRRRLDHSLYGYTDMPADFWPTVIKWIADHHQWNVDSEWMRFIPGIVKGIGFVVNVFCKPDEKVIIQPPVYHPFRLTPLGNKREVVMNPLIMNEDGSYSMDFEGLAKVADEKCRVLILANPHNPAGIVWDVDTLRRLADFCSERGIIVISDEIHCDMAHKGFKHHPFASVSERAAQCSITFGAPSKTFNIAGIVSSYCVVPNEELRRPFFEWLDANELSEPTIFSPIATIAAFQNGEEWRQQMLEYVEANIDFVDNFLKTRIPQIKALRPQASFLIWLNCRDLNLDHDALNRLFVDGARLALNDGEMFGEEGRGFMRMNIASPRAVLQDAMERLEQAVKAL
ncbi:MalY/PatB family protein [Prevotella sp.]|uniref:MalY/PatB family protein n=1 Tax=Prevotella sp. TaxID=59823 RepID=UPI00308062B1